MKKILLASFLLLACTYGHAQIIVHCETPASVAGSKGFTWADPAGGWGTADLNIPANSIKDTVVLVDDGTAGDSLGCNGSVASLQGKIALVYRGSCEFGVKAKHAQDSGAVGVIIINNVAGSPVGMGPASQGANVTIPTVMISNTDGAALRAAMTTSSVVVFIGNKKGLYNNDLGFYKYDLLVPRSTANPKLISANASEFNATMGGWIHNYGINSQSNVTLNAVIWGAASYSASSTPVTIAPGDSVFATIPTYTASTYSGLYKVKYSIGYGNTDDFNFDNSFYTNFLIDSLFSYALIDSTTELPINSMGLRFFTNPPAEFKSCIHFRDPNASRIAALGLYTASTTSVTLSLAGESIDVVAYEWNDVFTGLSDTTFPSGLWNLNEIGFGTYTYASDLQGKMVYIPFSAPVHLADNQRYLFCNRTYNPDVNLGFTDHFDYLETIDTADGGHDQPVSAVVTEAANYAVGFGTDATATIGVLFGDQYSSVQEQNKSFDVTPFPNPTTEFIKIPLKGMNGTAELKIMDMNGNMVNAQTVEVAGDMTVNVKGISSGNYVFNLRFIDGRNTTFKVVITK